MLQSKHELKKMLNVISTKANSDKQKYNDSFSLVSMGPNVDNIMDFYGISPSDYHLICMSLLMIYNAVFKC